MKAAIYFLIFFSAFYGCKNSLNKSSNKNFVETKEVIVNSSVSTEGKLSEVKIIDARLLSENILEIHFKYENTCPDDFQLYATGAMIKTLPPKIPLFLIAQKANCKKSGSGSLKFNISAAIPPNYNEFIFLINNDFSVNSTKAQ
jgi:hypothetical protein